MKFIKPKSNLLAWLRNRRKPKPPTQMEIMLMNELLELIADVNALLAKLDEKDAEIISLKSALLASEIQSNKDSDSIAAIRAKIKAKIDETPGGSTGLM
jgi:hypothetical protein